jgi:hypothetical protein
MTKQEKMLDSVTLIRYILGTVKNCESGRAGNCRGPFCLALDSRFRGNDVKRGGEEKSIWLGRR